MSLKTYGTIGLTLILAIAIAYVCTPFVIKLAYRIGWLDIPKDKRRMHKKPIPLLGGLSIIAGFLLSTLIVLLILGRFSEYYPPRIAQLMIQILPGAAIIAVMAFFDDRFNLPPLPRLAMQCVAAGIAVALGARIQFVSLPVRLFGGPIALGNWLSILITVIWIVGMTNAMNWIDGLDGLAAGIASIASGTLLILATLQGRPQLSVAVLTAALAGGCLGLLPYNRNPARIFMGDTGAMFLGYVLGVISIQGLFKFYAAISFLVPILILALPILDTSSAILRRLSEGKSPFAADRSHIHHQLIDMGLSQKQAVWFLYAVSATLSIIAILFTVFGKIIGWRFLLLALVIVLIASLIALKLCRRYNAKCKCQEDAEAHDCTTGKEEPEADEQPQTPPESPDADVPQNPDAPPSQTDTPEQNKEKN
ncbi:glycosyltransferase family 4 protein [Ethanoligenens sp.]|uniref:glycosyltransferase family 4 protein n=1 Tax=Ethanoligenens sp. TaxID=2099655 RepID=UPI0039E849B1